MVSANGACKVLVFMHDIGRPVDRLPSTAVQYAGRLPGSAGLAVWSGVMDRLCWLVASTIIPAHGQTGVATQHEPDRDRDLTKPRKT